MLLILYSKLWITANYIHTKFNDLVALKANYFNEIYKKNTMDIGRIMYYLSINNYMRIRDWTI